jgi:prolipoprotein diacylglyceryltransferase
MSTFPDLNPALFSLGGMEVRWYGLVYATGIGASYFLIRWQARAVRGCMGRSIPTIMSVRA